MRVDSACLFVEFGLIGGNHHLSIADQSRILANRKTYRHLDLYVPS